jgi:hypothetical protein
VRARRNPRKEKTPRKRRRSYVSAILGQPGDRRIGGRPARLEGLVASGTIAVQWERDGRSPAALAAQWVVGDAARRRMAPAGAGNLVSSPAVPDWVVSKNVLASATPLAAQASFPRVAGTRLADRAAQRAALSARPATISHCSIRCAILDRLPLRRGTNSQPGRRCHGE